MDSMILRLRHLVSNDEIEAAQLHIKCLAYIDETSKILASRVPSYYSRSTSPCRVTPIFDTVCFLHV